MLERFLVKLGFARPVLVVFRSVLVVFRPVSELSLVTVDSLARGGQLVLEHLTKINHPLTTPGVHSRQP